MNALFPQTLLKVQLCENSCMYYMGISADLQLAGHLSYLCFIGMHYYVPDYLKTFLIQLLPLLLILKQVSSTVLHGHQLGLEYYVLNKCIKE